MTLGRTLFIVNPGRPARRDRASSSRHLEQLLNSGAHDSRDCSLRGPSARLRSRANRRRLRPRRRGRRRRHRPRGPQRRHAPRSARSTRLRAPADRLRQRHAHTLGMSDDLARQPSVSSRPGERTVRRRRPVQRDVLQQQLRCGLDAKVTAKAVEYKVTTRHVRAWLYLRRCSMYVLQRPVPRTSRRSPVRRPSRRSRPTRSSSP